jgi:hypothetical protein
VEGHDYIVVAPNYFFDYWIGKRMRSSQILVFEVLGVAVLRSLYGEGRYSAHPSQGAVMDGGMLAIFGKDRRRILHWHRSGLKKKFRTRRVGSACKLSPLACSRVSIFSL